MTLYSLPSSIFFLSVSPYIKYTAAAQPFDLSLPLTLILICAFSLSLVALFHTVLSYMWSTLSNLVHFNLQMNIMKYTAIFQLKKHFIFMSKNIQIEKGEV